MKIKSIITVDTMRIVFNLLIGFIIGFLLGWIIGTKSFIAKEVGAWEQNGEATCQNVFAKIQNDNQNRYPNAKYGYYKYVIADGQFVVEENGDVAANAWVEAQWTPTAGFVGDVTAFVGIRNPAQNGYLDSKTITASLDCREPEPSITPTPTLTPETPKGFSEPSAPQCTDSTPLVLPSNVHVVRHGTDATVNFFTSSSNANIYFRTSGTSGWQHALRDIPVTNGYVSVTIHDLSLKGDYDFGIQSSNSCAGGQIVLAVVVDDYSSRTFTLSHYEWLN